MAAITEVRSADDPDASPRRRAGRTLRVATVAALGVAAVAALVYALTYQPLVNQGGGYWGGEVTGPRSNFGLGEPGARIENVFGSESVVGPLGHGGRFGFVVDIQNRGRFPVVVEGVEPVLPEGLSRGTQLFVATDRSDPSSSLIPAGHFTVPAHGYRTLGFAIDVRDGCKPGYPGGTDWADQVRLHYRFAGVRHTATVRLDHFAIALSAPPRCEGTPAKPGSTV